MIKKLNIILVLLLLFITIGAVSASEDVNDTIGSDESISDIISNDFITDEVLTSNSHTVNSSNYGAYFNSNGDLISSDVKEGDTINIDGSHSGKSFTFSKKVNVIGTSSNNLKNCIFTFNEKASGSTISNLNIRNTEDYSYGVFLNGASNCVIQCCFINNTGQSSYAVCIANNANYNNVTNNNLNAYGITYGHGTRSTPPLLLSGSHYNYLANNVIGCDDANAIYLSSFSGGPLSGGKSTFNTIFNNTIKYNVLPTSWSFGIQVMGGNNRIDSNKVIGSYRGISTSEPGNVIVNNFIINLTGADYNNPTVQSGGDIGIVGSYNSIIRNNTIINARIISTGAAITALTNSIVEDNTIEVILQGAGINPQGSNVTIKNNKISTDSGAAIYHKGNSANIRILDNDISSQSGIGILIQKDSNKKRPNNITITGNTISTSNKYAIDAIDVNASSNNVIGNNKAKGKSEIKIPEGTYDPSKVSYNFNGTTYNVTPDNFDEYVTANGALSSDIKDGDILNFTGNFSNHVIFVNSAIKITGNNPIFYNTTFRLSSDGVWIENIIIKNNKAERLNAWGILVYQISGATILNCDIEVFDPNAAYAIYVVESSDVDVINNKLASTGNYLTYTLLAYQVDDCRFINNTINTIGTGRIHQFENEHKIDNYSCLDGDTNCLDGDTNCLDGDTNCLDGDTNCLDGDTNCLDGDTNCLDGDTNCLDGDTNCLDGDTNCLDGDTNCLDGDTNCLDGDTNCLDGDSNCIDGNTVSGNHVLSEVYRTYGILMAYSSGNIVSGNKVTVTTQLNESISNLNSTNSIVGIDLYYNSHDNVFSNNEVHVKAKDNYIYGMGVLGYYTTMIAPEGEGATNNQYINNNIVLEGTYFVQGIVIGDESEDTLIEGNVVTLKSDNVAYGVSLEMSQKSTIRNNTFTLDSDVIYGMEGYESSDNIIDENSIDGVGKQVFGIIFSNSNRNNVTSNLVIARGTGGNLTFKNFDTIQGGNAGILFMYNSTNNLIDSNNVTSLKGYAVVLDKFAVDNIISNNYLDSEMGIANKAVNSTNKNTIDNNYKYVFSGELYDIIANYLESATFNLNLGIDGALVKFTIGNDDIANITTSDGAAVYNYKLDDSFNVADYSMGAVVSKEDYLTKEFSATLIVKKGNLNVTSYDVSGYDTTKANFIAIVKDVFGNGVEGANVKFYRYQGRYIFIGEVNTDKMGIANLTAEIPTVSGGNYEILANVSESSNFKGASSKSNLEIIPRLATNIIINSNVYPAGVLAVLKYGNGTPLSNMKLSVVLNERLYSLTTGADGSVILPSIVHGTYKVSITFKGEGIYKQSSISSSVTVKPAIAGYKNIVVYYGNKITYKVRIVGSNGKYVGAGQKVAINVNKRTYYVYTDKNGYASKSFSLNVGSYTITSSYNGDKVSSKITVKPTLIAKNIVKKKSTLTKFSVKLVNKNGKILKNKRITFRVGGKTYYANTNKNGIATASIKNLKVGKFTITSSYGGCKISNTITVKK